MTLAFILSAVAGGLSFLALIYAFKGLAWLVTCIPTRYHPAEKPEDEHIQILVVGDVGRSPRMQYHAMSVAKHGRNVDIVGYKETARHPDLIGNPRVTMYALPPQPEVLQWGTLPFFLNIPCKVIWQFWGLFFTLMYSAPPAQWIIIQNPPSIPTFHVVLLASLLRGSKLVVDWHNYGYTILATQSKWYKPLVPIYRWYETLFGRFLGDANLSVTDAMALQLKKKPFNIKNPVYTLHDRPADVFQPITFAAERRAFLSRLPETKADAKRIMDGKVRLIVSSTSWTKDEDFGLLLDALVSYASPTADEGTVVDTPLPVLAIITGKGPQKEFYLEQIKKLQDEGKLPGIRVITAWLSTRDYASLLACADLGVSLHKSSSGVDLPMKVVDMFGAGLPVAAYSAFESFGELIKEGQNGCGFETSAELTTIFQRLLGVRGQKELARLKDGAVQEGSLRWDEEWDRVVGKVIGVLDQ
ncbi:family 33 glycosyltransferase [Dactylonectria estremocensis]|uniref:Chitobiosyldiphosphodolichol beta-mannosyltransferase n=1 Tax=Dactylonectria estremocensis TaxID=1079267 RepID=A0A9P9EVK7_9HYPO|nr:family 33 glycosyltransferase [Dactylonectria estremocensis]